jgi:two-component system, NarL family, sensor kinase
MKRVIALLLVASFFASAVQAQQQDVKDSLMRLIADAKEDSAGVELYLKTGMLVANSNAEQSGAYYLMAKTISEKIKYKKGVIKSLIYYSDYTGVAGKYDSSLILNQQALVLAKEIKDTFLMGTSILNIGIGLQQLTRPEEALGYYLEGKRLIEKSANKNNKQIMMQVYDALQTLYNSRAEYDKAIEYGEQAVQLAKQQDIPLFLTQCLLNLSFAYRYKKNYSKAETLTNEALSIARQTNDKRLQAAALLGLGSIWEQQGAYYKIMPSAKESLRLSRESSSTDLEVISLAAIATCYLQIKKYREAEVFAKQSLELSRKIQAKEQEYAALRILSRIAYANGQTDEAAAFDRDAETIMGDYVRETISQQSSNLEKKYETEKKNNQIIQLNKDRKINAQWNYILIGALATLLIISLLSYRTYQQKQKLQQQQIAELEKEKQLLAAEAVLKGQEQERTRLAKDLHDGLGGMLSGMKHSFTTMKENLVLTPDNAQAFERSMNMLDSSIKELRMVAHNLMPESLVKFGMDTALKDFCGDITASGALKVNYHSFGMEALQLNQNTSIIIYRIIQELINNTIKHAEAKEAIVQLQLQNNLLDITVEDDGKGFDVNSLSMVKGMGWSNIKNRAEYLKAKLNVHSQQGKGTSVQILLDV